MLFLIALPFSCGWLPSRNAKRNKILVRALQGFLELSYVKDLLTIRLTLSKYI